MNFTDLSKNNWIDFLFHYSLKKRSRVNPLKHDVVLQWNEPWLFVIQWLAPKNVSMFLTQCVIAVSSYISPNLPSRYPRSHHHTPQFPFFTCSPSRAYLLSRLSFSLFLSWHSLLPQPSFFFFSFFLLFFLDFLFLPYVPAVLYVAAHEISITKDDSLSAWGDHMSM